MIDVRIFYARFNERRAICVKKNSTNIIKVLGWIASAAGGLLVMWANDRALKEEVDEKIQQYIAEATSEED